MGDTRHGSGLVFLQFWAFQVLVIIQMLHICRSFLQFWIFQVLGIFQMVHIICILHKLGGGGGGGGGGAF